MFIFFQSADILKDIIINAQETQIGICEHSYEQLLVIVIWSLATNLILLCMIVFLESWERIKKFVRLVISKIQKKNE